MTVRVPPAEKEDLRKPVMAKKKEITTTSEELSAPEYLTRKRRKFNCEIPERKND